MPSLSYTASTKNIEVHHNLHVQYISTLTSSEVSNVFVVYTVDKNVLYVYVQRKTKYKLLGSGYSMQITALNLLQSCPASFSFSDRYQHSKIFQNAPLDIYNFKADNDYE